MFEANNLYIYTQFTIVKVMSQLFWPEKKIKIKKIFFLGKDN